MLGSRLSCSQGQWAGDLLGAFLYRAPRRIAYQWIRDGQVVPGVVSGSITASSPGSYSCRVIASNAAGQSSQASASRTIAPPSAKIVKAKIKHHSATFTFTAAGATGFRCALIKQPTAKHHKTPKPSYSACRSPKRYQNLKAGAYTFLVRGLSAAIAGPAASKTFKIT